jgi:ATP/maltotriose-dependent transcriptional regulator MalT
MRRWSFWWSTCRRALHLVLASRSDPPLPLPRLRAGWQLAELRTAELRFTAGEAGFLLGEAIGADLDAAAVAALTYRTEGWAAGLQLAALSSGWRALAATLPGPAAMVCNKLPLARIPASARPSRRIRLPSASPLPASR